MISVAIMTGNKLLPFDRTSLLCSDISHFDVSCLHVDCYLQGNEDSCLAFIGNCLGLFARLNSDTFAGEEMLRLYCKVLPWSFCFFDSFIVRSILVLLTFRELCKEVEKMLIPDKKF